MHKKKFLWLPVMVLIFLSWGIYLSFWTISNVSKHKISQDYTFMDTYQNVDKNFNNIMQDSVLFLSKYNIILDNKTLSLGKNQFKIIINNKDGTNNKSATIKTIISRYERSDADKTIEQFSVNDDCYISKPFEINLKGRWIIDIKATIKNLSGYVRYYVYKDGTISVKKDIQQRKNTK